MGELTRQPCDAIAVFPHATAFPSDLKLVARTSTATQPGVAAAQTYLVLDRRPEGVGTRGSGDSSNYGDRWLVKLRQRR